MLLLQMCIRDSVRRLLTSHQRHADDSADMTDVTLVLIRIFLKILWFDRVTECVSDLPDLAEPDFLIVLVVVGREILLDDRRHIAGGFLWEVVFNLKQIVEEIADVLDDLLLSLIHI